MKTTIAITALSVCAMPFALAVEPNPPKPQGAGPCKEAPAIIECVEKLPEPQTEAIPAKYAQEKAVAIKLEDLKPVGERLMMQATLRIINPTDKPMKFTGYSEKSPITLEQHWKDGKWVEQKKFLRCGTGLRQCTIAPGQSAVFTAPVYAETMPTRIGISYSQFAVLEGSPPQQITVWSEKIER